MWLYDLLFLRRPQNNGNVTTAEAFSNYSSIASGMQSPAIRLTDIDNDGDLNINAADCSTGAYTTALRPGNSLTIPRMALSIGFTRFVSSTGATQTTGI